MRQLTRFVISVAASAAIPSAALLGPAATAAADGPVGAAAGGGPIVPFSPILRRCDYSNNMYVEGGGNGQGFSLIRRTGNTVTAEVHFEGATPDTTYGVRLIQMPRSAAKFCGPGSPGVVVAFPTTDSGGNAYLTLQQDVIPGATGAWVFIDGPLSAAMPYGEYYSSDFVAAI